MKGTAVKKIRSKYSIYYVFLQYSYFIDYLMHLLSLVPGTWYDVFESLMSFLNIHECYCVFLLCPNNVVLDQMFSQSISNASGVSFMCVNGYFPCLAICYFVDNHELINDKPTSQVCSVVSISCCMI